MGMDVAVVALGACWAVAAVGFGLYAWGTKKREKEAIRSALIIDHFRASDAEATKRSTRTRSADKDTVNVGKKHSEPGDSFYRDNGDLIVWLAKANPGMRRPFYVHKLQHLNEPGLRQSSFEWMMTYVLSKLIADGRLVRKGLRYFVVGA